MQPITTHEGALPFHGRSTGYRVFGEPTPGRAPLLCLHGGPGMPSDYLNDLALLAETGRQVVLYDQLGCGRSACDIPTSELTLDLFVAEVAAVRAGLGLDEVHLLGHSWGGMLALEYMLTKPSGVRSLILASTTASIPLWAAETGRLRRELSPENCAVMDTLEATGRTSDPAYAAAFMEFVTKHVCRIPPPEHVLTALGRVNNALYASLWGASEFQPDGALREWDVTGQLGELHLPTLIISGEHDEATPALGAALQAGIPGAQRVIVAEAAHIGMVEQPDAYRAALTAFLAGVEGV